MKRVNKHDNGGEGRLNDIKRGFCTNIGHEKETWLFSSDQKQHSFSRRVNVMHIHPPFSFLLLWKESVCPQNFISKTMLQRDAGNIGSKKLSNERANCFDIKLFSSFWTSGLQNEMCVSQRWSDARPSPGDTRQTFQISTYLQSNKQFLHFTES